MLPVLSFTSPQLVPSGMPVVKASLVFVQQLQIVVLVVLDVLVDVLLLVEVV